MRDVTRRLPGQAAGRIAGCQRLGQRGNRLVLVEILRGEVQAFVGGGHRDADRDQRIAAQLKEVRVAFDIGQTQALAPDALQRRFHRRLAGRGGLRSLSTAGRCGGRPVGRRRVARPRRLTVLDPMPLPLKGITRQREKPAGLPTAQRRPIDLDTRGPELPEREQEGVAVVAVLRVVAHQPDGMVPGRPPRVPRRRRGQRAARADLDQDAVRVAEQHVDFVGESDRRAHLARPGCRVGGLAGSQPGPGHVGQQRDLRFAQRLPGQEAGEFRDHRIHQARVERVRRADPARDNALLGEAFAELANTLFGPGDNAAARLVDRGDVDLTVEVLADRLGTQRHRDHDATRRGVHQAGAHRDHLDGRLDVEDPGDGARDVLADAVSGQRRRLDTVALDQLGQRILDGEQRGLGAVGAFQIACGAFENLRTQVDTELVVEAGGALVEVLSEHRLGVIQAACHPDVLRTLTGEQEDDAV